MLPLILGIIGMALALGFLVFVPGARAAGKVLDIGAKVYIVLLALATLGVTAIASIVQAWPAISALLLGFAAGSIIAETFL